MLQTLALAIDKVCRYDDMEDKSPWPFEAVCLLQGNASQIGHIAHCGPFCAGAGWEIIAIALLLPCIFACVAQKSLTMPLVVILGGIAVDVIKE